MAPRHSYLLRPADGSWLPPPAAPGPGSGFVAGGDGMDFFRQLWRSKWLILAIACAGGLAAAVVSWTLTPRYMAEARILVGVEVPKVAEIPEVLQELTANQEAVQSESYVLQSRSLASEVAERLALEQDPEFNPRLRPPPPAWRQWINDGKSWLKTQAKALVGSGDDGATNNAATAPSAAEQQARLNDVIVSGLLSKIEVTPLQRSRVIAVQAQSENPETAARLANGVADTYIEQQMMRRISATEGANEWLDKRIADLRAKVEEAERAVEDYRREHELYETRSDAVTAQQVSELNRQLIVAESAQAEAESRLAQVEAAEQSRAPAASLPEVLSSPVVQGLKQREAEVQREAAEASSIYGPQHPRMRDIRAQLSDIRGKIAVEVDRAVQGLRHEVAASRARTSALRANLDALQGRMGELNEESIRLRELERQADANRRLLVSFLDRAKELSGQPAADAPTSVVISRATVPFGPSFPPSTLLVLLGAIGGTLVGALIGLLRENLDRSFRTVQQIEDATNLPILGVLPPSDSLVFAGVRAARRSSSAYGHAVSNLFERLAFSPGSRSRKVLMLTSATPREGKSQIAASLIRMATGSGLRVIVLDCDWRRPAVHQHFGQEMAPGLGDLLSGTASADEVVFHDTATGAHAIFAGDLSLIADGQLRYERLRLLLTTLANHYDLVILDTPPVLAGPDALVLAQMVEEVVFVVRWGQAPRDAIFEALNHLDMAGARLGGAVLSGVDRRRYRDYGTGEPAYAYPYGAVART